MKDIRVYLKKKSCKRCFCCFLSSVSWNERGESWGGECRWQQFPRHICHPERWPADGLLHHVPPHHLLRTDTAWLEGDSSEAMSSNQCDVKPRISADLCWCYRANLFCLSISLPLSVFKTLEFWEVWLLCGRYAHSSEKYSNAVNPRLSWWQPSFFMCHGLYPDGCSL